VVVLVFFVEDLDLDSVDVSALVLLEVLSTGCCKIIFRIFFHSSHPPTGVKYLSEPLWLLPESAISVVYSFPLYLKVLRPLCLAFEKACPKERLSRLLISLLNLLVTVPKLGVAAGTCI
jgi:hypothetical protein